MQLKKTSFIAIMFIGMILASGCISGENDTTTTTAAPVDTFFMGVTVDGDYYEDVGLSEIKSLTYEQIDATMVKKTGEELETSWGGTSFYGFMESLGVSNITTVTLVALDGYEKELEYAQLREAMLAWEDETGAEIAVEDGGPIRFVAPGLPSNTWIQNLIEIRVSTTPVDTFFIGVYVNGTEFQQVGLSEIKSLTYEILEATLVDSNGAETQTSWGGTTFVGFLEYLGITNVADVTLVASDGYQKTAQFADLGDSFLAWEDEAGAEISEEDGGPIRFVAPSLASSYWMKNLTEIQVTTG